MKNQIQKTLRYKIQLFFAIALLLIVIIYNLYIKQIIGFKILGIADLNPYGAWSALKDWVIDSSYEFEGLNRSIALTIAILTISILGGRFFCGWICPLGALQDLSLWVSNKLGYYKSNERASLTTSKDRTIIKHNLSFIKYPLLLMLLFMSILGYGAIIAELSPWRALLNIPRMFNAWTEMKLGFFILILVSIIATVIPKFFCRYLCPLGAIQALFSSFSLWTIKGNENCIGCNRCLYDCPMGIEILKDEKTVSPECIRCMNCVDNCKLDNGGNLSLELRGKNPSIKAYALTMIALFLAIWLLVPKIWTGSAIGSNISTANLKDGLYHGEAKGFTTKIITEVVVTDGMIQEIKIIQHHESKGWYDEVFMILPREIIKKQTLQVDAISGATKTSKGLVKSIEDALRKAH